jgi:phosphatidylglycerophosphate synthase
VTNSLWSRYFVQAAVVFSAILCVVLLQFRGAHRFTRFGPANYVTLARAALVSLVAAAIGEPHRSITPLSVAGITAAAMVLDWVDGWVARRTHTTSTFGARFDVEVDALLILALSILTWQYAKAGAWIVLAGLLRYAFVAAGVKWPWLKRPLAGSVRGKTICAVQIAGSIVALLPAVTPPWSALVAGATLAALVYSFTADTIALHRRRSEPVISSAPFHGKL